MEMQVTTISMERRIVRPNEKKFIPNLSSIQWFVPFTDNPIRNVIGHFGESRVVTQRDRLFEEGCSFLTVFLKAFPIYLIGAIRRIVIHQAGKQTVHRNLLILLSDTFTSVYRELPSRRFGLHVVTGVEIRSYHFVRICATRALLNC